LAAVLLASQAAATGAASADGRADPRGGTATAAAAPALTLINGDRVLAGSAPGGPRTAAVLRGPGSSLATSLMTVRLNARTFLIPWAALPYLGRGLDPRLFDVGALRHAEQDGRLPVTIRYQGQLPALPGVTVTRSAAGTAQGYLTAASASLFGAALARQMVSDHPSGSYGSDGLFADGVSISLPGAAPAPIRPRFPMHTLTVAGTSLAGRPDTGDIVEVFNVNDLAVFGDPGAFAFANSFYHGTAKYSAPSGTYWAIAGFFQIFNHGRSANLRLHVLPQFTVAGNTRVRLSARAATSKITIATPRRAVAQLMGITLVRSAPGAVVSIGAASGGGSLWVSPTSQRPTDGTLRAFTTGQLTSPPGPRIPYAYTLDFPAPAGIIPRQHFAVRAAGLATVSGRYFQDVPSTGAWVTAGGTAYQWKHTIIEDLFLPLRLPGRQIQYLSANPAMFWLSQYSELAGPLAIVGTQTDALRLLHGGQHLAENWNRYPLHPGPNVSLPGSIFLALPSAVRAGNKLILDVTPFSDNQRGHTGAGFSGGMLGDAGKITGSYALYEDGVKIAGGDAVKAADGSTDLFVQAALSPRPSLIRFVLNASRTGKQYRLSTGSRDVWTWRSRPGPTATVPPPWLCGFTSSGQPVRRCVVQQMLMPRYQVAGLSLAGATRPGSQAVDVTVAAPQEAAPSEVTHATVRVSFNGGKTWRLARVRRAGASQFRALFTAPRSQDVTLRITARAAAGATVTETIRDAYRTSA